MEWTKTMIKANITNSAMKREVEWKERKRDKKRK
jgi:hypothetical protein